MRFQFIPFDTKARPKLYFRFDMSVTPTCSRASLRLLMHPARALEKVGLDRLCCTTRDEDEMTPTPGAVMPLHGRTALSGVRAA